MSSRITASLRDIEEYWTLIDVLEAHQVLDAIEVAEWEASQPRGK